MGCEPEMLNKKASSAKARKLDLPKGVPPLTSIYMYIAGSCNLACHHCWISPTYEPDNSKGQFLKPEYIKKAVREAKPLGLGSVKLTGGEPMLHPQFKEIIDFLNNEHIEIIIETNGTLIDEEAAVFLKSKPYMRFISVSIDGADAKTNDSLRGIPGSFNQAIAGIDLLKKAGISPQVICTLHKGNVGEINNIIEFVKKMGVNSLKFNHVQKIGRGGNFSSENGLTVKEIIDLHDQMESEKTFSKKFPIFFDIPMAFFSIRKLCQDAISNCSIKNIIGILSGGEISLCGIGANVPELIFGNCKENSVKDIWDNNPFLAELRGKIPSDLEGICSICIFKDKCLGNCIANNYHSTKKCFSAFYFCESAYKMGLFPENRINMENKNEIKTKLSNPIST